MDILDKILSTPIFLDNPPILLDIGASGEIHPKWSQIAKHAICIAFDADDRDFDCTVNESMGFRKLYLFNRLVTEDQAGETDFFLTRSPYCSSLLKPDQEKLSNWAFSDLFDVERVVRMKAVALPHALREIGVTKVDWFKTDSQGTDLRLFLSLGEEIIKKVLIAEFEPGILDAYQGEDKLCTLMSFMDKQPFWVSDLKICGTQRISRQALSHLLLHNNGKLPHPILLKSSPGWGEVSFFNSFGRNAPYLDLRDYLLGWIFAFIEGQHGFALDIALQGTQRFGETIFEILAQYSVDTLSRQV